MKREGHSIDHVSSEAIFKSDHTINQKRRFSKVRPGHTSIRKRYPVGRVKLSQYQTDMLEQTFAGWGIKDRPTGSQIGERRPNRRVPRDYNEPVRQFSQPKVRPAGQVFRGVSI